MTLIKSIATPVVWVLLLMAVALILTRFHRSRRGFKIGWCCLLAGMLILLAFSLDPVANLLTYSLECRYAAPLPDVLKTLDVIVVLGGGAYPSGGLRREPELSRYAYPRLYHGVEYFKNSSASVIAFSGGPSRPGAESEAEVMQAVAVAMDVPKERTVVEVRSVNTMTNVAGLAEVLPPGEGRRIGVVTAATHMMRSEKAFEQVFPRDTIVPLAVHFTYNPAPGLTAKITPKVSYLEKSTIALHEWLGILWYAVRY
ncbi:MAG: YdcF family protein [Phycisphaerae bacterium]|nr:YdcF family protein [Phycisphaerae bacterium]